MEPLMGDRTDDERRWAAERPEINRQDITDTNSEWLRITWDPTALKFPCKIYTRNMWPVNPQSTIILLTRKQAEALAFFITSNVADLVVEDSTLPLGLVVEKGGDE